MNLNCNVQCVLFFLFETPWIFGTKIIIFKQINLLLKMIFLKKITKLQIYIYIHKNIFKKNSNDIKFLLKKKFIINFCNILPSDLKIFLLYSKCNGPCF